MTFDEVNSQANQMLTDEELNSILREKYPGPAGAHRLAQNLISIFGAQHPEGQIIKGPITVVQSNPAAPAIRVVGDPDSDVPPASFGGGGGLPPEDVTFPSDPPPDSLPPAFPVMLYGIVQSGTGQNYTVTCYAVDPSVGVPLGNYSCFQGQIDPSETIPPLTHCFVWASVGVGNVLTSFRMTVPVFIPTA